MNLQDLISKDQELLGNSNWLHGSENDSLVVDVARQLFFWNSRGIVGDAYTWLTKIKGMPHDEAKEFLRLNDQDNLYGFIHTIQNEKEVVVYPKLVDIFYENGMNESRDYWYRRGITDKTIHRFKLGFCDDWYMIPLYQDGIFRNFQKRREVPFKVIKSYYSGVGRLLFNSDLLRVVDEVYICEGPTDALRLIQEGVPAISHNAGSEGWDPGWFKYFINVNKINIIYDNDKAGKAGAKIVAKNLGVYRCKIYTFDNYDDKFDVIDFFREGGELPQLKELVNKESKYAFEL